MNSTPKAVIDAVIAQQAAKRAELAQRQALVDDLRRQQAEAQTTVDTLKAELDALRQFLSAAGVEQNNEFAKDGTVIDLRPDDGAPIQLSGRAVRDAVVACATEVAAARGFFTVDDVMAKIAEKGFVLGVEHPRIRASQVLTLTKAFVYDEIRKAWKSSSSANRPTLPELQL